MPANRTTIGNRNPHSDYTISSGGRTANRIAPTTWGSYFTNFKNMSLNELLDKLNYLSDKNYEQGKQDLSRILSNKELETLRHMDQSYAARTGGRLGSTTRKAQDIGGKYATALEAGLGQLRQQKLQDQWRALQAYIQKYGIDKNAELAMQQLQAQQDMASGQAWGSLFGSLASAAMLALLL